MHYTSEHAQHYAAVRRVNQQVLASLADEAAIRPESQVLEAGCGSGNYLLALGDATGCTIAGLDPSEGMLNEARLRFAAGAPNLTCGKAEDIGSLYPSDRFDLVFSVDMIHHVADVPAYFGGVSEILKRGGRICTVTDNEEIIRGRVPLSTYWPETVPRELSRYPSLDRLEDLMRQAGFDDLFTLTVSHQYRLTSVEPFERKVFSSLHLIRAEDFERGLSQLRKDLARAPLIASVSYILLWGTKPE